MNIVSKVLVHSLHSFSLENVAPQYIIVGTQGLRGDSPIFSQKRGERGGMEEERERKRESVSLLGSIF